MGGSTSLKRFRVALILVIFACLCDFEVHAWYDNNYEENLAVYCPATQNLYRMRSRYSSFYRDRRFDLRCRTTAGILSAVCTPWKNYNGNGAFSHVCEKDHYLNDIRGVWVSARKDRDWSFRCCKRIGNYVNRQCLSTLYVNDYRQFFDYIAPEDYVITGVATSSRHLLYRDRRWRFTICRQRRVLPILPI